MNNDYSATFVISTSIFDVAATTVHALLIYGWVK